MIVDYDESSSEEFSEQENSNNEHHAEINPVSRKNEKIDAKKGFDNLRKRCPWEEPIVENINNPLEIKKVLDPKKKLKDEKKQSDYTDVEFIPNQVRTKRANIPVEL